MHDDLPCKDLRIICADAAAYAFPKGDLVVYMYNPFGEKTVERIAANLAARRNGGCYIVYHTPVHRAVLDADVRFEVIADLQFGTVYRLRVP
jgi:hypothetical protein